MATRTPHMGSTARSRTLALAAASALAALAALSLALAPDVAYADSEVIASSSPGLLDQPKFMVKLIYDLIHGTATSMLQWASEFWGIIAQGRFIGGDLSSFPEAANMVQSIINRVVVPVAQGCLGLMLAFELLRINASFATGIGEQIGLGGFEQYLFFAVKYSALYVLVNHIYAIMYGIFAIFNWMERALQSLLSSSLAANAISPSMLESAFNSLTYDDMGMILALFAVSVAVLAVTAWTCLYSQVLAISRIFEIFVLIAFSAIPLTTFANKTLNNIGIEFAKTFCGACMQLAVIYAIVGLGGPIIASISSQLTTLFQSTTSGIDVLMAACVPITSALALYTMLKSSRTLANKVFGIMF